MINKEEDIKLLRNNDIILNYLETDGKVESLWNEIGKYIKLVKVNNLMHLSLRWIFSRLIYLAHGDSCIFWLLLFFFF